jgi:hypothetical protein
MEQTRARSDKSDKMAYFGRFIANKATLAAL